jgi:5-methyltetrahydropteroyltriglutamate--homocysteine methyltransferase
VDARILGSLARAGPGLLPACRGPLNRGTQPCTGRLARRPDPLPHLLGSWHGPHAHDIGLADIIDLVLQINASGYSIEAANSRHEHEYHLWERIKLPEGKILIPGVVTHATNLIEHPELVAERIIRFADRVGKENVIAGADCGFGSRIHPQLGWAKMGALVEGAELASRRLWNQ